MPAVFQEKKARIIKELVLPGSEYKDLSPKGSIDEGIRELLDEINAISTLVTTSSCAGRVSVYVEGKKLSSDVASLDQASAIPVPSSGGKGGGHWLYVSHDPIVEKTSLCELFGLNMEQTPQLLNVAANVALIHLKFEAMILHLLTATLEDASKIITAASCAGFRESGAMGLAPNRDGSINPMVAVRSNGLALDCVVGYINELGDPVCIVPEDHLRLLINITNERFQVNSERIARFRSAVLEAYAPSSESKQRASQYEDADVRRARKRAEGLARQAEHRTKHANTEHVPDDIDSISTGGQL